MASKEQQKELDKAEAAKRGITYKEVRQERRAAKRSSRTEADQLRDDDHHSEKGRESKRLRTYSKEDVGGSLANATSSSRSPQDTTPSQQQQERRRTRSFDERESQEALTKADQTLTVEEWRKEHTIAMRGHGANASRSAMLPDPFREFSQTPFCDKILQSFRTAGFVAPTAIQAQAWPIAIDGQDMICVAKTGSGKTCGFLLPAFHSFLQAPPPPNKRGQPRLLVLAPTRELSVQIMEEAVKFGRAVNLRSLCCYGGSPKYPQIAALQRGVDCVIATPGRLNDLIEMRKVNLSAIEFLVLDEADRMLDMGFEPQIRSIIKMVPDKRQTLLFSATWPKEIQALAHDFLKDPIQINVGEVNVLVANKDIKQHILMCRDDEKFDKLAEILKDLVPTKDDGGSNGSNGNKPSVTGKDHAKVIVFVAKKVSCNDLANRLWDDGFAVDSLHGDRAQWERTRVMSAFKSGQLRMLIATDVAARGLDVKDVGVVVNFDMPGGVNGVEDYVHRIGRTGRAGAKGIAYTFFTGGDKKNATQLCQVLQKSDQEIPPELQAMARPRGGGYGGRGYGGRGYGRGGGRGYGRGGGGGGRGYMGGGGGGGYGGRGGGRGRGGYRR